jgi:hypothetical protein
LRRSTLDPSRSRTASSINDGTLSLSRPRATTTRSYPEMGASAYHLPSAAAVNTVREGGVRASRLRLPVLPSSDLRAALR